MEEVLPSSVVRATSSSIGWAATTVVPPSSSLMAVLDPSQAVELALPARRVVDFQHHRRDQGVALRNQRIVGLELARDLLLAAALNMEHLVDLHPHGLEALEMEGGERADGEPALALQCRDRGAAFIADLGVVRHVHDIGAGERAARLAHRLRRGRRRGPAALWGGGRGRR